MKTGEMIRRKRKEKGLSQGALGGKLGLSTSTISQYERGELIPNSWTLMNIASILECPLEDIATPEVVETAESEMDTARQVKLRASQESVPQRLSEKMKKYIIKHPAISAVLSSKYGIHVREDELLYDDKTLEQDLIEMLSAFGNLEHTYRQRVVKRTEDIERLLSAFQCLNDEGCARAIEFVYDLSQIERYKRQ